MAAINIKVCKYCGQDETVMTFAKNRRTECRKCEAARKKRWEDANRERMNQRLRDWAQNNPERAQAIKQKNYAKHGERYRAKLAAKYKVDPEPVKEKTRAWAKRNPERRRETCRAWVKANPLRAKTHWKNRKARKRNMPCTWKVEQAEQAMKFFQNSCAACSTPFGLLVKAHWDHWIPLIEPGCPGTVASNMIPLCAKCNLEKNDVQAVAWLRRTFPQTWRTINDRIEKYLASQQ